VSDIPAADWIYYHLPNKYEMPFREGWPLAVISTTPRSGTWYNHYLFGIYNQLLLGNPPHYVNAANFDLLQGIQLNMSIVHANCPGFEPDREMASLRGTFGNPFSWADPYLEANPEWFSLERNEATRFVFINRNPLDHCVSIYRHLSVHSDLEKRAIATSQSIDDFLLNVILPTYIYRYASFRALALRFPDRVEIIPYESMVAGPERTFRFMLEFFGRPPANDEFVRVSLDLVRPEKLQEHERRTGKSLEGQAGQSHIRSGKAGMWRGVIDDAAIQSARREFLRWDIDFDALTRLD
jgi:hypothetical protein